MTASPGPATAARASRIWARASLALLALTGLVLVGCGTPSQVPTAIPTGAALAPDWFHIKMTDVRTGQSFAIEDFAGKVVLVETMAEWCPTCALQQNEVRRLHDRLDGTSEVVSVSLDIDLHEDAASLKSYAADLGADWYFAVAPLEVARALGNLYSAEYLNPPFSPMLLIDRIGGAHSLPYGLKPVDVLRADLEPYLSP